MKSFRFKLYKSDKNAKLHKQINAAGLIYNHCIALHKRYYKIFGKYLNKNQLQKHLVKLKRMPKFGYQTFELCLIYGLIVQSSSKI